MSYNVHQNHILFVKANTLSWVMPHSVSSQELCHQQHMWNQASYSQPQVAKKGFQDGCQLIVVEDLYIQAAHQITTLFLLLCVSTQVKAN